MRKQGFTLLEMIVSIVISGIVLSAVMISYVSLSQANIKADISRQLQKEINFAMIRMADKVRSFSIDYGFYASQNISPSQSNKLFTNGKTDQVKHRFEPENFTLSNHTFQTFKMDGQPLFSKNFDVKDIYFYVTPEDNPFDPDNIASKKLQLQPKVTIFLDIESIKEPEINFQIQTTISSRKYQ